MQGSSSPGNSVRQSTPLRILSQTTNHLISSSSFRASPSASRIRLRSAIASLATASLARVPVCPWRAGPRVRRRACGSASCRSPPASGTRHWLGFWRHNGARQHRAGISDVSAHASGARLASAGARRRLEPAAFGAFRVADAGFLSEMITFACWVTLPTMLRTARSRQPPQTLSGDRANRAAPRPPHGQRQGRHHDQRDRRREIGPLGAGIGHGGCGEFARRPTAPAARDMTAPMRRSRRCSPAAHRRQDDGL